MKSKNFALASDYFDAQSHPENETALHKAWWAEGCPTGLHVKYILKYKVGDLVNFVIYGPQQGTTGPISGIARVLDVDADSRPASFFVVKDETFMDPDDCAFFYPVE